MEKFIHASGKRKSAIARATLTKGTGKVTVNQRLLDVYSPKIARMKIREPMLLAGDVANSVNISVTIFGGGSISQADAARLAIGRALSEYSPGLKETFLSYDRQLLIADVRRKETRKPNCHGKARAKRQKSYR